MDDINKLPVLILTYNRFDKFRKCIDTLYNYGVRNFFISIDGPKNNSDRNNQIQIYNYCEEYFEDIDIKVNNIKYNLGCRNAPINGINWFFKENKYGAILEDDVIISKQCLKIFSILLQERINHKEILTISSFNELSKKEVEAIYSIPVWRSWGWASWADRWNKHIQFSRKIEKYSMWKLYELLPENFRSVETVKLVKASQMNLLDAWDYEFNFFHFVRNYRSLTLGGINNFVYGFDDEATHYVDPSHLGIDFRLFDKNDINPTNIIEYDNQASIPILKKCGFYYLKNKSKLNILCDFLKCKFYSILFYFRKIKRIMFKRL